jgi:hypothetical protein
VVTFWGFAFGREIEAQMLVLLLMFIRITAVEFCTSARLTQNPWWWQYFQFRNIGA